MVAYRALLPILAVVIVAACGQDDVHNVIHDAPGADSPPPPDAGPNGRCEATLTMATFDRAYDSIMKPAERGEIGKSAFTRIRPILPGSPDAGAMDAAADAAADAAVDAAVDAAADAMADAMPDAVADAGPDAPPDSPPDTTPDTSSMGRIKGSISNILFIEVGQDGNPVPVGAGTDTCNVLTDLGNLGDVSTNMAVAFIDHPQIDMAGTTVARYGFAHELQAGAEGRNIMQIELWEGFGTYASGVHTGAVTLTGPETNFAQCGACVLIYAKANSNGQANQLYIGTGGTLQIDSF